MRSLDVLILGGGPAALVSAALLGRSGLRGLVIDQNELGAPDRADRRDWSFDDRLSPILAHVHDALGLQEELRRKAQPLSPGWRLVGPARRGEFEPEAKASAILARILEMDAGAVESGLETVSAASEGASTFLQAGGALGARGFFERRKRSLAQRACTDLTVRAADRLDPRLEAFFTALLPFFAHLDTAHSPALGRLARIIHLVLRGPRLPDGGRPLRSVLEERAQKSGFEVHRGLLTALEPDGRSFLVEGTDRRDQDRVRFVIDASRDLSGLDALPHGIRAKRLAQTLESARPAAYAACFPWTVDAEVLPEPLGPAALLLNANLACWLTLRTAGEGRAWVEVEHRVSVSAHRSHLAEVLERIEGELERVVPFWREGEPQREPGRVTPLLSADLDPDAELAGIGVATPLKNVLIAGPAVAPGCLALESAYMAALEAAQIARQRLGAASP